MKLNVYYRVKVSTMGNLKLYLYSQSEEFFISTFSVDFSDKRKLQNFGWCGAK